MPDPAALVQVSIPQRPAEDHPLDRDIQAAALQDMVESIGFATPASAVTPPGPSMASAPAHGAVHANAMARALPGKSLPALLAAQAARSPQAVALIDGDVVLTYGALDERANRLAPLLASRGAAPELIVAIALPRGIEFVVAILAVVKTGSAFLPLDPDMPVQRLAYMLADSQPMAIVTTRAVVEQIDTPTNAAILCVDTPEFVAEHAEAATARSSALRQPASDNLAFVIYTSGPRERPRVVATRSSPCSTISPGANSKQGLHQGTAFS